MDNTEKDPAQCRRLREIDRDVQSRMGEVMAQHADLASGLGEAQDQIHRFNSKLEELEKTLLAANAASAMRGGPGAAAGVLVADLSTRIAANQSQLDHWKQKYDAIARQQQHLRDEHTRLTRSLADNARPMHDLNCVI